jgi:hypothetical protein
VSKPVRRSFSWRAFALVATGLTLLSLRWYLQRHYSEHGWSINWYRSMTTPVFYSLAVGLPLLTALAAERLIAGRHRLAAASVTAAAALFLIAAVPAFTAWDAESGAMADRNCRRNLRQLAVAMQMYADANGGLLPPGDGWVQAVRSIGSLDHLLRCPADAGDSRLGYALNAQVAGAEVAAVPERLPMLFDADRPVAHPGDAEFRHRRRWGQLVPLGFGVNVAFADGDVGWVSRSDWQRRFSEP